MHDRHSRAGAARTLVTVLAGLIHLLMLFLGCAFVYPIDANSLTFMTLTCQFQAQDTLDGPHTFLQGTSHLIFLFLICSFRSGPRARWRIYDVVVSMT